MKKIAMTICLITLLVGGCAGRDAYPVGVVQVGDSNLSCDALKLEMSQNETLIAKKLKHDQSKLWSNIFWFIWFPPLMDVKEAEKIEAEALQRRNNRLEVLMVNKKCD